MGSRVLQGCPLCRSRAGYVLPVYQESARRRDARAERETRERVERASAEFEQSQAEHT
jgi:hypothetical protein